MLRPCGPHFYPPSLPETHSLGFGWDSVLVKDLQVASDRHPAQADLYT